MPTANDLFDLRPALATWWPPSLPILAHAVETWPTVTDDRTGDRLDHVALALVEVDEAQHITREVRSVALGATQAEHIEVGRLPRQRKALLDALEQERAAGHE